MAASSGNDFQEEPWLGEPNERQGTVEATVPNPQLLTTQVHTTQKATQKFEGKAVEPKGRTLSPQHPRRARKRAGGANSHRTLLSPIRLLPPEVLNIIFCFSLPDDVYPRLNEAPLSVSHVCSTWRDTALGSPHLWDSLSLNLERHRLPKIDLPEFWLSNAASHPLSISIAGSVVPSSFPRFLNSHSESLRKLDIRGSSLDPATSFLRLPKGSVPLLESIKIRTKQNAASLDHRITIFDDAPQLREVTIEFHQYYINVLSNWVMPWAQLTHLEIQHVHSYEWHRVFRQCVQLQSGRFIIQFTEPHVDTNDNHLVRFPNLKTLSLRCNRPRGTWTPATLLNYTDTPALSDVELGGPKRARPRMDDHLCNFLSRGSVRRLILERVEVSTSALLSLLSQMPMLEKLAINLTPINYDELCSSLDGDDLGFSFPPPVPPILPKLVYFAAYINGSDILSPHRFSRMIYSRFHRRSSDPVKLYVYVSPRRRLATELATSLSASITTERSSSNKSVHIVKGDGFVAVVREPSEPDIGATLDSNGGW